MTVYEKVMIHSPRVHRSPNRHWIIFGPSANWPSKRSLWELITSTLPSSELDAGALTIVGLLFLVSAGGGTGLPSASSCRKGQEGLLQFWYLQSNLLGPTVSPSTTEGLTWLLIHSGSLHSFPLSQASSLSTMPVFWSATGLGWL